LGLWRWEPSGKRRDESWRATCAKLERRVSSGGINSVHDVKANMRQSANPASLITGDVVADALVNSFVCAFVRAVFFRVVSHGKFQFYARELMEGFPKG
jgi:hypothetical protein